jgi:hypothetical protein
MLAKQGKAILEDRVRLSRIARPLSADASDGRPMTPVSVVGEYGAVSRWRMPLSWQRRSNSTRPGPGPNRAVNTLPLSVLPQLHRPGAFPTLVVLPPPTPLLGLDQPMAHQRPVHTGASRQRQDPLTAKLGQDAAWPPARMRPPQATIRVSTCGRSGGGRWPAWSSGRPAHQDLQPRTGAATHAPFAGQPRSGALRPPPSRRRQGPPAQPGSAAPPAPTPPARCRPPPLAPTQGAQRRRVEPPDQPATVTHLPEPVSPRTRSRVPKLSASSRSHSGKHPPRPHSCRGFAACWFGICRS